MPLALTFMFIAMSLTSQQPLQICLMLVPTAVSMGAYLWSKSFLWPCFAIWLVFVGGMMVMFIYVATLGGNAKLNTPQLFANASVATGFVALMTACSSTASLSSTANSGMMESNLTSYVMFLVGYLLLSLVLAVKLTESLKGALVKIFK